MKKNKGEFTKEEDILLTQLVTESKKPNWKNISKKMKNRDPKQCRERWQFYLHLKKQEYWTNIDDDLLIQKFHEFGEKWDKIIKFFPNKSINYIKGRLKKLQDPRFPNGDRDIDDVLPIP